jgi:hypothetical protein
MDTNIEFELGFPHCHRPCCWYLVELELVEHHHLLVELFFA